MGVTMTQRIRSIAILVICLSTIAAAQQNSISGKVSDSEGAAIADARVYVHWDSSGSTVGLKDNIGVQKDLVAVTDAAGKYSMIVPPGFYDVFVSAGAFTPAATKVRVKKRQRATFNAKLGADPLVTKELGH